MAYPNVQLLIGGKWGPSLAGKVLRVVNPATNQAIGTVAHAGAMSVAVPDHFLPASSHVFFFNTGRLGKGI